MLWFPPAVSLLPSRLPSRTVAGTVPFLLNYSVLFLVFPYFSFLCRALD